MPIVAAVDRSERAPAVIVEVGVLAAAFDAEVHAVSVPGRSDSFALGRTPQGLRRVRLGRGHRGPRRRHRRRGRLKTDVAVAPVWQMGDEANRVVDYARDHEAQYIVVGPRRRSPRGVAMLDSVAQDIVLHAKFPVVSVVRR